MKRQSPSKLTPARAREMHAKLDELIQSNDRLGLNAVVLLMDTLSRPLPARRKRSSAAMDTPRTRPRAERLES
jgi:hypothetical protein